MRIGGFQKLSLLNYPEKTACTVFTAGCNFRCPFCHNGGLVTEAAAPIGTETVLEYLRKRKGLLEGVCISGGEPLMQKDILTFMKAVKELGYSVKLDTNGSYPNLLEEVITSGLADYVTMDVKNIPERYAETAGIGSVPQETIVRSLGLLKKGTVPYEFRTTVVREFHTETEIASIAEWLSGASVWYLQPFRDAPEVLRRGLHAPDLQEMERYGSIGNRYVKTMVRQ